jgi:hypothetical protein
VGATLARGKGESRFAGLVVKERGCCLSGEVDCDGLTEVNSYSGNGTSPWGLVKFVNSMVGRKYY